MKRPLIAIAAALLIAAGLVTTASLSAAPPNKAASAATARVRLPPAAQAGQTVFYGHIKALSLKRGRYELRFDPAWWLSGTAAEHAAVEDKVIKPGEPVPNDYYIVDRDHRLLTFVIAAKAHVTILDLKHLPRSIAVTVPELADIVRAGTQPGFWVRVGQKYPNPAISLDQQYQP